MIHKLNTFMLRDIPIWNIEQDCFDLRRLMECGGVLFWCREGEWRAIGGPQLETIVERLQQHQTIHRAYITADLACMAADQAYAYDEWYAAIPVPAELVRWLRHEAEQLSETDTSTESASE